MARRNLDKPTCRRSDHADVADGICELTATVAHAKVGDHQST
jgi:hypothetical protein